MSTRPDQVAAAAREARELHNRRRAADLIAEAEEKLMTAWSFLDHSGEGLLPTKRKLHDAATSVAAVREGLDV